MAKKKTRDVLAVENELLWREVFAYSRVLSEVLAGRGAGFWRKTFAETTYEVTYYCPLHSGGGFFRVQSSWGDKQPTKQECFDLSHAEKIFGTRNDMSDTYGGWWHYEILRDAQAIHKKALGL